VEHAPAKLARAVEPGAFARGMVLRLVVEAGLCMVVVAALALPLIAAMAWRGSLDPATVVMAAACAILGGGYFLGFVLAGQSRFGALGAALALATAAHVGAVALLPAGPLVDLTAFLGSCVLLVAVLVTMLADAVGQAWRYRINQGDECTP